MLIYQGVYMMGEKNMFLLPEDICAGIWIKGWNFSGCWQQFSMSAPSSCIADIYNRCNSSKIQKNTEVSIFERTIPIRQKSFPNHPNNSESSYILT